MLFIGLALGLVLGYFLFEGGTLWGFEFVKRKQRQTEIKKVLPHAKKSVPVPTVKKKVTKTVTITESEDEE